jgi:TIR domain-containing protein/FHA domain-containing protein
METITIFCCYARKDKLLQEQLFNHLEPLRRSGQISTWYDREILPGTEWKQEIDKYLNTADIVLLLISPNFMASDYCYSVEMNRALERQKAGEVRVIPIILRPVNWKDTPIGALQALPPEGRPVVSWPDRDAAFATVVLSISSVVSALQWEKEAAYPYPVTQKAQVSVEVGGKVIAIYPLNKHSMTVGRSPRADISTPGPTISVNHGIIRWVDGAWVFLDAGTTNGTFFEGKRLTRFDRHTFTDGDRIYLGGNKLAIHFQLIPSS